MLYSCKSGITTKEFKNSSSVFIFPLQEEGEVEEKFVLVSSEGVLSEYLLYFHCIIFRIEFFPEQVQVRKGRE